MLAKIISTDPSHKLADDIPDNMGESLGTTLSEMGFPPLSQLWYRMLSKTLTWYLFHWRNLLPELEAKHSGS